MDLIALESVCAVRTYQSYSEAAYHLFLSPTTVSKHILRVESELGSPLFVRAAKGRKVTMTVFGESVIDDLQSIVDLWHKTCLVAQTTRHSVKTLTIGITPLVGTFGEDEILAAYTLRKPDTSLVQQFAKGPELARLLCSRAVDGAFVATLGNTPFASQAMSELDSEEYDRLLIGEHRGLRLGIAKSHPLSLHESFQKKDFQLLRDETFIFSGSNPMMSNAHARHFLQDLFGLKDEKMKCIFVDMRNQKLAMELVRRREGILPCSCPHVPAQTEDICWIPVEGWNVPAQFYFISRQDNHSTALKEFRQTVAVFKAGLC